MGASLAAGWTVKPMIPGRLGTTPVLASTTRNGPAEAGLAG